MEECWTVGGHTAFKGSKSRSRAQNEAGDTYATGVKSILR